jgi:hypothetical protein
VRELGIDDPVVDRLHEGYRHAASENQILFRRAAYLLRALREEGIETLVLKGAALALGYYGDPGLRPMTDLDVLVRPDAAVAAGDVLRQCGWLPDRAVTPTYLAITHAEPFRDPDDYQCDLHWRLFGGRGADADAGLWSRSVTLTVEGVVTRTLSPTDHLLHVCVHGTRWVWTPGIRWVADAHHILRAGTVDWDRLVDEAATRRLVLPARDTLGYLRERMKAPVPAEVLAWLGRSPVSALDRLDYRVRSRPRGRLGTLPIHLCNYLGTQPPGHPRSLAGFALYLQELWRLPSLAQLPRGVFTRAYRGLRVGPVRRSR